MEIIIFAVLLIVSTVSILIYYKGKEKHHQKQMSEMQREISERNKKREYEKYERMRQLEIQRRNDLVEKKERFHTEVFPISTDNEILREKWKVWDLECHNEESQLERQERALYNVTPILINADTSMGYFLSSDRSRIYETHLFACSCPDFESRNLPCKHIYCLFYDLNRHKDTISGIIDVLPDVSERFIKLSNTGKLHFLQKGVNLPKSGRLINLDGDITWNLLIKAKLVQKLPVPASEYIILLNQKTKTQIIEALEIHGITGCRSSWTKEKIVNWIEKEHPEFLQRYFINYAFLTLPKEVATWADGVKASKEQYSFIAPKDAYWV